MCHKSKGTINNNNNNNNSNNNIKLQNLEHLKLFTAKSSKQKKKNNNNRQLSPKHLYILIHIHK